MRALYLLALLSGCIIGSYNTVEFETYVTVESEIEVDADMDLTLELDIGCEDTGAPWWCDPESPNIFGGTIVHYPRS